jgi:hypothetical protein
MLPSVRLVPLAVAVVMVSGCGGGQERVATPKDRSVASPRPTISAAAPRRAVALAFVPVPRTVIALCRRAGEPAGPPVFGGPRHPVKFPTYHSFPPRFPIYCPVRLPKGVEAGQNLAKGRTAYEWEVFFPNDVSEHRYGTPHALLGGQQVPFPLRAGPGGTWPPVGERGAVAELQWPSRLAVAGGASIGTREALALRFPALGGLSGGPNGAHLVVVFNIAGHGYFVSVHFDRLSDRARIQLASAFGQWLQHQTPVPAARPRPAGG